jgi:hypothetical protein
MSSKKGPDPGTEIRDPEKIHPGSGSRIQGVKKHRIPDPDPQHCWRPLEVPVPVPVSSVVDSNLFYSISDPQIFFRI